MRRWAAGTHNVPPGIYDDLLRLVHTRIPDLDRLQRRLRAVLSQVGLDHGHSA
jgi:hypothetical protein